MKRQPEISDAGGLVTMPDTARTGHRSFRIPNWLYLEAMAIARANGEHLTDVVRKALKDYIEANR